MAFKRIIALAAALLILAALAVPAFAAGSDIDFGVELSASSAYIVNANTGRVVYAKNENERMAPASCTKIMTCALAMELCDDLKGTVVTVPFGIWNEFDGINISNAGLRGGEEITMWDLIACMLVQSANEAASVVADYFGRDNFIDKMNRKAKELGCTDTHFVNPHGLDDEDHYTTARDLYRITEWAIQKEGFLELCSVNRYTLPATNKHDSRDLIATNKMLEPTSGYYTSYIRGVKTGTTDRAGRCLVSTAEKDGMIYVSVLLGCPTATDGRYWENGVSSYTDARLLYDWCFKNLRISPVAGAGAPIAEIELDYAKDRDYLLLYSASSVETLLDRNNTEQPVITYELDVPESVSAPVEEGKVMGTARVYCDGTYMGTVDLVTRESVEKSYFAYFMGILSRILISVPAMIVYALMLLAAAAYVYFMAVVVPKKEKARSARHDDKE